MKSPSHYINRWRNESEARRQRRALLLASGITLSLFVFWLASWRLSAVLRGAPTVAVTASVGVAAPASPPTPGILERIRAGWRTVTR